MPLWSEREHSKGRKGYFLSNWRILFKVKKFFQINHLIEFFSLFILKRNLYLFIQSLMAFDRKGVAFMFIVCAL